MTTQEISRDVWRRFLDEFGKQHQDEPVTVHVIGEDIGVQPEVDGLALVGITTEDSGSERGTISLMLGTEAEKHIEHHIASPTHLWVRSVDDHTKDALEIESADGTKTILEIQRVPAA